MTSSLFYSLAFLYESPGPLKNAIAKTTKSKSLFVYGISDKKVGGITLQKPDGNLAPRTQTGALLNSLVAAQQAVTLARSGRYDTICIHGDTPGAGHIASSVRAALREAGIETAPLGR